MKIKLFVRVLSFLSPSTFMYFRVARPTSKQEQAENKSDIKFGTQDYFSSAVCTDRLHSRYSPRNSQEFNPIHYNISSLC